MKEPKWIAQEEARVKNLPPEERAGKAHNTKRWQQKTAFPVGIPERRVRKGAT
jgi:hypothetical protein